MLTKIELNNFRKHRALNLDFTSGLNTIRAQNEGGKSTLIEAVSYALFGSRALRTPIEDTVTWGEDTRTLKVSLDVTHSGKNYKFTRSKGGAEVVFDGEVFVTGQNEVSNFASEIIGADLNLTNKLMFSGQNSIRAAIEEGPKALSQLIENLAGMDVFDTILENAQNSLAMGSTSFILEQLAVTEARFNEESKVEVEKPDTDKFNSTILTLTNEAATAISRCAELEIEYAELKKKNDDLSNLYLKKKQLLDNIEKADESISGLNNQLRKLQITTSTKVDDEEIERLKSQIKAAENHSALKNEHVKFMSLVSLKRFDGDESAFDKALQRVAGEKDMCRDQIHAMNMKITNLQNSRINHDTCDKCGQGISHLEHVKEKNAQIDEQLELLTKELLKAEAEFNCAVAEESELQDVRRGALSVKGAYNLDSINYDNSFYPPKVMWVGGDIPDTVPVAPKAELTKLLETKKAVDTALAQVDLVKQQINDMQNRKHDFVVSAEKLNAPTETEIIKINADLQSLANEYKTRSGVKETSELEIERLTSEFVLKQQVFSSHDEKLAALRGDIAQCKKNIETINFNNALIRKLRTIRPIIADKIWNTVLGSVSVMFSQIRGTPSVISKDKDGFKCNNQSVDALSGSTLDAFGLALRCALIRTFIPECGILVLDEPAHGMDGNRTAAMLGFIQSIDMGQTILITHEDVSSSIASNIIEL